MIEKTELSIEVAKLQAECRRLSEALAKSQAEVIQLRELLSKARFTNMFGIEFGDTMVTISKDDYNNLLRITDEQTVEVRRLKEELAKAQADKIDAVLNADTVINQLQDYAADLRICMREARKVLKDARDAEPGTNVYDQIVEAIKILKEGLKSE
jgi:hypothetical protein